MCSASLFLLLILYVQVCFVLAVIGTSLFTQGLNEIKLNSAEINLLLLLLVVVVVVVVIVVVVVVVVVVVAAAALAVVAG
jgi:hypothetical protein